MKGKFDAYVLWPLAKKFLNWIVDRSTARNFTVYIFMFSLLVLHFHLIYCLHSLEFEREMRWCTLSRFPTSQDSDTKAQSILMQLVVLFLWDWMRSSRLFYGLSLTSSWTILNYFCLLQCWNINFLYLGCTHSIFLFNFWGHFFI